MASSWVFSPFFPVSAESLAKRAKQIIVPQMPSLTPSPRTGSRSAYLPAPWTSVLSKMLGMSTAGSHSPGACSHKGGPPSTRAFCTKYYTSPSSNRAKHQRMPTARTSSSREFRCHYRMSPLPSAIPVSARFDKHHFLKRVSRQLHAAATTSPCGELASSPERMESNKCSEQ